MKFKERAQVIGLYLYALGEEDLSPYHRKKAAQNIKNVLTIYATHGGLDMFGQVTEKMPSEKIAQEVADRLLDSRTALIKKPIEEIVKIVIRSIEDVFGMHKEAKRVAEAMISKVPSAESKSPPPHTKQSKSPSQHM